MIFGENLYSSMQIKVMPRVANYFHDLLDYSA